MDSRYDRFEFGVPDRQEKSVIHHCSVTGHEIYEGENYLLIERDIVEETLEALTLYTNAILMVAGEEVEGE